MQYYCDLASTPSHNKCVYYQWYHTQCVSHTHTTVQYYFGEREFTAKLYKKKLFLNFASFSTFEREQFFATQNYCKRKVEKCTKKRKRPKNARAIGILLLNILLNKLLNNIYGVCVFKVDLIYVWSSIYCDQYSENSHSTNRTLCHTH